MPVTNRPNAAEAKERSDKAKLQQTRIKINRELISAPNAETTVTSAVVTADNSDTIISELTARGYVVTHDGTSFNVSWAVPGAISDGNLGVMFIRADDLLAACAKSGAAYVEQQINEKIQTAYTIGVTSITYVAAFYLSVQTSLLADSYTVSHDGTTWTVSWTNM